jgi:ATP-dependent DNA helicase RecQ
MSLWDRIKKSISDTVENQAKPVSRDASRYAFIDVEVGMKDHRIHDIGALDGIEPFFTLSIRGSCWII